jgi:hypothetical protein
LFIRLIHIRPWPFDGHWASVEVEQKGDTESTNSRKSDLDWPKQIINQSITSGRVNINVNVNTNARVRLTD